jgi:nucleoside-diphosphate-sugar epimerase
MRSSFCCGTYWSAETINVGVGRNVTIGELARIVAGATGFSGEIAFDTFAPRRLATAALPRSAGTPASTSRKG